MFSLHGGFLTIAMYHHRDEIKFTDYDDTKKRAHDSYIVRAIKKTSRSAMVGSANGTHQARTNRLMLYVMAIIKSEACPTVVQFKRKP